ncbi:hypothetical protein DM02DRAFT_617411 [Periconia macrospinosa]|uniref:Carbohydrate-binding module family 18 protein n=1 Tax=Periconia macrospinosa TaxID=97972 RepID=A0A2V1DDT4_9PLEO|nr:hypothetical protein DM02DRAFT_617411 [Periconia macrospinosa]
MRCAIIISFLFIVLPTIHAASNSHPFQRRDTCTSNEEVCDTGCMDLGAVCCHFGNGFWCYAGEYCVKGQGCCEEGTTCTGSGGTSFITPSASKSGGTNTITGNKKSTSTSRGTSTSAGSKESTSTPLSAVASSSTATRTAGTATTGNTVSSRTSSGSFVQSTGIASSCGSTVGLSGLAFIISITSLGVWAYSY